MERTIKEQVGAATWESWPVGARMAIADAQATIAALQARVNGLEKDSELLRQSRDDFRVKYESVKNDAITLQSQLTQRTAERDTARRRVDELEAREVDVVLLRDDLEQRTAELEAANKLLYRKNCELGRFETIISDLQAELERVSLLFSHSEHRFEMLEKKYKELRTLIAALPKVEGEIRVGKTVDNCWFIDNQDAGGLRGRYKDDGPKYAALLQHRQGMEG